MATFKIKYAKMAIFSELQFPLKYIDIHTMNNTFSILKTTRFIKMEIAYFMGQ